MPVRLFGRQQREDYVVAFTTKQIGEKREQSGPVPIAGIGGGGVGGKTQVFLVEEIVAPDAEHLACSPGFFLADRGQAGAAIGLRCKRDSIERLGERGVPISRLSIGDHHLIGGPPLLMDQPVESAREGILVVGVRDHRQRLTRDRLHPRLGMRQRRRGHCEQEILSRRQRAIKPHDAPPLRRGMTRPGRLLPGRPFSWACAAAG